MRVVMLFVCRIPYISRVLTCFVVLVFFMFYCCYLPCFVVVCRGSSVSSCAVGAYVAFVCVCVSRRPLDRSCVLVLIIFSVSCVPLFILHVLLEELTCIRISGVCIVCALR